MKSMLLCSLLTVAGLSFLPSPKTKSPISNPNILELKLVAQLPAELPQRISRSKSYLFNGHMRS